MTTVIHSCGWKGPHVAHSFDVLLPPTIVTTLCCPGTLTFIPTTNVPADPDPT